MPIEAHDLFQRPPISVPLWRYTDLSKFVDLLTSQKLWLSNLEVLARDDPYEGSPWSIAFPHRMWSTIENVPEPLRTQIANFGGPDGRSPEQRFKDWYMLEEQTCIFAQSGRREYYVNCWHAAQHESVAMWKIYGAPGAGVAVITNGARLETALASNSNRLLLGAVRYAEPNQLVIGTSNAFEPVITKGAAYQYEQEVRLVFWETEGMHDPLAHDKWNPDSMRFEDIIEDPRPLKPGIHLSCDVNVLVDRVLVSPFAAPWYLSMIEKLRDQLGFRFPVIASKLLTAPQPAR
ncbi:DUF2971 domain-containing protein [Rhizobium rhizogenes]|uniref:DUF2971 domain-containing protein n=1 Tax=Rhizobium rhizogenes TaxID=359 RepID=UPI003ECEE42A